MNAGEEAMAASKKKSTDWRAKAKKLIAMAVGEKTEEARRSFAMQAANIIAEHKLLDVPERVIERIVSPDNMGEMINKAKETAETIRGVASDPNVQGMAAAAVSFVGALADMAGKRKR
jgi:hypothetical protein